MNFAPGPVVCPSSFAAVFSPPLNPVSDPIHVCPSSRRAGGDSVDVSLWTFPEAPSTEEPQLFMEISTTPGVLFGFVRVLMRIGAQPVCL
jgi:hypothetical protein